MGLSKLATQRFGILYFGCAKRCDVIMSELNRDERCYTCPVYKYCKGDCHQLVWEDDICAAPRFLMKQLQEEYYGNIN